MATHILPKVSELDPNKVARGSDVLANDQSLSTFLNGQNIDQGNINPAMTPQWTGIHRHSANLLIDNTYYIQIGNTGNHIQGSSNTIRFFLNGVETLVLEEGKVNLAGILDLQGFRFNIDTDGDSFLRSDADESISYYLNDTEKENINLTAGQTNKNIYGNTVNQYLTDTSGTGSANLFFGKTGANANSGFQYNSVTGSLNIRAGNTVTGSIRSDGTLLLPDVSSPEANYLTRKSGAKAWGSYVDNVGFDASYNIDALTDDDGDGVYNITFATDFSTNNYCIVGNQMNTAATSKVFNCDVISASEMQVVLVNSITDLAEDDNFAFACFGDQ